MKKLLLSSLSLAVLSPCLGAQNLLNAKTPEHILQDERAQRYDSTRASQNASLAYEYVADENIAWSRMVWETIDLRQKLNYPYYYPIDTLTAERGYLSLFDALMTGIRRGEIKKIYADSYFRQPLTEEELEQNMERIDTLDLGIEQVNAGERVSQEYIDEIRIGAQDIRQFKIRGLWYFDKRLGALRYRLLGIAPVAPDLYQRNEEGSNETNDLVELFWVWYPDARKTLYRYKVFNPDNVIPAVSYDDLLNARRFSSTIYQVSNASGTLSLENRYRGDSARQAEEALKLKNEILNTENDQWSY